MLISKLFICCMMISAILGATLPEPGKGPPEIGKKENTPENMKGKMKGKMMPKEKGKNTSVKLPKGKALGKLGNEAADGKNDVNLLSKQKPKSKDLNKIAKNPKEIEKMIKQMMPKEKENKAPTKVPGENSPGKRFGNLKGDGKKEPSKSMKLKMQKPTAKFGGLGQKSKGKTAKFSFNIGKYKNGKAKKPWKSAKPFGKMPSNMGTKMWEKLKSKMGPRMWGKLKSKGMVNFVDPRRGFKVTVAIYVEPVKGWPPFRRGPFFAKRPGRG